MSSSSNTAEAPEGISLQNLVLQFALMGTIFYLWSSPVIQPAKIMVVLFHEMSHGIMAMLTGGKVLSIQITQDEGGACATEGGMPLLIVSAGYLGSMLFGGVLLYLSRFKSFVPLVYGTLSLVLVSAILTVLHGEFTKPFASVLAAIFIFLGFFSPAFLSSFVLRLLGTLSCLYSIFDIYWDILSERGAAMLQNDAIVFASMSGIDVQTVGMSWLIACVVFFFIVLRMTLQATPEERESVGAARAPATTA